MTTNKNLRYIKKLEEDPSLFKDPARQADLVEWMEEEELIGSVIPIELHLNLPQESKSLIKPFINDYIAHCRNDLGRKRIFEEKITACLEVVFANLVWAAYHSADQYVSYSRNTNSYSKNKNNPRNISAHILIPIIDWLFSQGWLHHYKASDDYTREQYRSCFCSSEKLLNILPASDDVVLQIEDQIPIIRLKSKTRDWLRFRENRRTKKMKQVLLEYNRLMLKTDLTINGKNVRKKTLYRIFNDGSFDFGGRYFGASYQRTPKTFEDTNPTQSLRKDIRINGEEVCEYDYRCTFPTLLYAKEACEPSSDSYEIKIDGVEVKREDVKKVLNILFNNNGFQKAVKAATWAIAPYQKGGIAFVEKIIEDLKKKHPKIKEHLFQRDVGLNLMNIESQMAEYIMRGFVEFNEVVLVVHDSFICTVRNEELLKRLMMEAYVKIAWKGNEKPNVSSLISKEF